MFLAINRVYTEFHLKETLCFYIAINRVYTEFHLKEHYVSSYKQGIYRVSFEGNIMFLAINRVYTEFHLKETCF